MLDAAELQAWLDSRAEEMAALVEELVAVATENPPGRDLGRCGGLLRNAMARLGLSPEPFSCRQAKRGFPRYPNFIEGFPAVACADTDNPDLYSAWSAAAAASNEEFGYFGPLWTWITSICAKWTGADADRYTGPFNRATAAPVLIVGNLFDPATRYEGAVAARSLLPNSALLTLHGWGHTSLFLSRCVDAAIARYLVDVVTPAPGTVCEQDNVPFSTG